MILHAISMFAALIGESAQNPLHVQCLMQTPPEPWIKWLLPTIVQTVVSLASIGAGVAIAVWSFRKNHQTEHERWIRDQRQLEWNQLLGAIYGCQVYDPGHYVAMKQPIRGLHLPSALLVDQLNKLDHLMSCPIFVNPKIMEPLRSLLSELKKKRIVSESDMEDIYGSDPKWVGREAEWRNILWVPSEERDRLIQSINDAARGDLAGM